MYLAFDIGGTTIKLGAVNEKGEIFDKKAIDTPEKEKELLRALSSLTKTYQKKFDIEGIGISAPGVVSKDGVMTTFGALLDMYGLALREKLSGLTGLEVSIVNDANSAAIAEKWLGAAKKLQNYLVVALGTGLGGGIVINGEVYQGGHGMAGEFGWALTNDITPIGELEDVSQNFTSATILGLIRSYNAAMASITHGEAEEVEEAREIVQLAQKGDKVASVVFDIFVKDVAVGLMNLFSAFDPEAILIGGGISANTYFIRSLQKKFSELVSRHSGLKRMKELGILGEIKAAKLRNDAGLLGAAYTIKQQLKK